MGATPKFLFSPSGYDPGQEAGRRHKRASLFKHTNHTFVSKPSELCPTPATPLFGAGASVASFTFSAGSPDGAVFNNPFSVPNPPSPSVLPSLNFNRTKDPSVSSGGTSSSLSSQAQPTESLASDLADLRIREEASRPKRNMQKTGIKVPPLFTNAATDSSKSVSPSTEYGDSSARVDESSQDGVSGESELSSDEDSTRRDHLRLLGRSLDLDELNEIKTTPIFTEAVRNYALAVAGTSKEKPFSQYGLLAGDLSGGAEEGPSDPRIFWNIAAPSSFFICGSQGSGKSHTLSCLLENALAPCKANVLPRPLTGIVFHYDTFISDSGGSPCEVAWLSTNTDIKVRVLCPPTNIRTMRVSSTCYSSLGDPVPPV